jgi:micrococcal nuclease
MSRRRIISTLALLGVALSLQFSASRHTPTPPPSPTPTVQAGPPGFVAVTRVVDGDTIVVEGNLKVRLTGVNTPETVDPRRPVQCFGHEASDFTKRTLTGQSVKLVRDVSDTDKYGRLLRYVYLSDGSLYNLTLVREGYAQVNTYPPDVAHAKEFQAAQAEARAAKRGLWASCPAPK